VQLNKSIKSIIAVWLSAILLMLSFAAAAHELSHIEDGANTHCTLCFHQHQLDKILPSHNFNLRPITQTYELVSTELPQYISAHCTVFQSRAPPEFS